MEVERERHAEWDIKEHTQGLEAQLVEDLRADKV
jgi:hypothetical protein